jgi:hypothetical protein
MPRQPDSGHTTHRAKRRRASVQLGLAFRPTWGGRREGAGRKPIRPGRAAHSARPALASRHPVHVTLKVDEALPSLRGAELRSHVEDGLRRGREREGFRLVHYSVQTHHLHLIVEAKSARSLRGGVGGLAIRIARRINRVVGRTGRVFADRYFPRVLKSPRQTRAALAYVLLNVRRHAAQHGQRLAWNWIDECSSGRWFDGWRDRRPRPPPDDDAAVVSPRTWLLSRGWRRHGRIPVNAVPGEPT